MDIESLAEILDGREIRKEITEDEALEAKKHGLVVVFGASDDLMEFRGAINDEVDVYDGGSATIDSEGIKPGWLEGFSEVEAEEFMRRKKNPSFKIKAMWCHEPGLSWSYELPVDHATFRVMEDGEVYCRGVVFSMSSVSQ